MSSYCQQSILWVELHVADGFFPILNISFQSELIIWLKHMKSTISIADSQQDSIIREGSHICSLFKLTEPLLLPSLDVPDRHDTILTDGYKFLTNGVRSKTPKLTFVVTSHQD